MASGFSMLAAVKSVKKKNPKNIVVAVPTGSKGSVERISGEVEEVVCPNIRSGPRFAVAEAYEQWRDLRDKEVIEYLDKYENYQTSL